MDIPESSAVLAHIESRLIVLTNVEEPLPNNVVISLLQLLDNVNSAVKNALDFEQEACDEIGAQLKSIREKIIELRTASVETHTKIREDAEQCHIMLNRFSTTNKNHMVSKLETARETHDKLRESASEMSLLAEDIQKKLETAQGDLVKMKAQRDQYETERKTLISQAEQNEKAKDHLSDQVQALSDKLQAVTAEKDRAVRLCRENEALLADAKRSYELVVEQAGVRTKDEVEAIRRRFADKLTEVTDSMRHFEEEVHSRQHQLERTLKEKNRLSVELEALRVELAETQSTQTTKIQELTGSVASLEKERRDLTQQLGKTDEKLRRAELTLKSVTESDKERTAELEARLADLTRTCTELRREKLAAVERQKEVDAAVRKREVDAEEAVHKVQHELRRSQTELAGQRTAFEAKVRLMEASHFKSLEESKKMLTMQMTGANKWRKDYQTLHDRLNETVAARTIEVKGMENEIQNLRKLLDDSHRERNNYLESIRVLENDARELRRHFRESEFQSNQVAPRRDELLERRVAQEQLISNVRDNLKEIGFKYAHD